MATRKKYKIVLSEKYVRKSENGKEWFQFPVNISGQLVAIQTIIPLDPYTEPDMKQVKRDYDAFYKHGYEQGLSDAWEAARKVTQVRKYGGYGDCLEEVFGRHRVPWDVFDYSASEAIEKIRQYEQEKEEIKVGDEVVGTYTGEEETEPFVIIRKIPEINPTYYFGIYSKSGEFCQGGLKLKKTGRHFPEIAEVLRKMGES